MSPDDAAGEIEGKDREPTGLMQPGEAPIEAVEMDLVRIVRESKLFDEAFYVTASGCGVAGNEAIEHFLEHGEKAGLSPCRDFDVLFYRRTYPDVHASGMSSLLHYVLHGRDENRYPNANSLEQDIALITGSGLFDVPFYARQAGRHFLSSLDAIRHYLFLGESVDLRPNKEFDRKFYRRHYDDVAGCAFAHYLRTGVWQSRVASPEKLKRLMASAATKALFDAEHYAQIAGLDPEQEEEVREHYFLHGERLALSPGERFDAEFYLENSPDLARLGTLHHYHPFLHYAEHGQREERTAWFDIGSTFSQGGRIFSPDKPTCICINHDASRTGAPLVGLSLVRALAAHYNVITCTGRKGELDSNFSRFSCLYGVYPPSRSYCKRLLKHIAQSQPITFAIANSVETLPFVQALADVGIPTVTLVHEFAEYSTPRGKVTNIVAASDRCVFPAELVYRSLRNELTRGAYPSMPRNCVVQPQGFLGALPKSATVKRLDEQELRDFLRIPPGANPKVIVGAGYVQPRKGVDLFVQTAIHFRQQFGEEFRFLWVGEGYKPETDVHCSVWIKDSIGRAGLENHLYMLESQSDLDVVFDLADVFYLSSRLDPFPNVVVDALAAGVPVVCFDRATGCADFLAEHRAPAYVANYLDAGDAAQGIVKCLDADWLRQFRPGPEIVREELDFGRYTAFIEDQARQACLAKEAQGRQAESLLGSGHFDPLYSVGSADAPARERALLSQYLTAAANGVLMHAPRPGYDPLLANEPLDAGRDTHRCLRFSDSASMEHSGDLRVAVHIHLHYPELARGFVDAFWPWQERFDFFVSTNDEDDAEKIATEFDGYRSCRIGVFENRGRNFGALIAGEFVPEFANYDLIGHFHGKKSLHSGEENGFGGSWRNFILHTIVGQRGEALPFVLSQFAADPGLGLLFPEDRHLVGWGENLPHARSLLRELRIIAEPPAYCRFPLGGMFWARPAVLEPLWRRGLRVEDLPPEPLPYDGSMLHALERLMPVLAEQAGLHWATLHRTGASW